MRHVVKTIAKKHQFGPQSVPVVQVQEPFCDLYCPIQDKTSYTNVIVVVQEYQRCISDALAKSNQTADKEEDKPQVHHTVPYSAIKGGGSGLMKLKLKKSFCTNVSD